ncbi:MAG: alpha/beta hydrolase-fold protein [Pirellulaceae bacterium]|nr:alpha/beta hydrolase-fold protein [Pirellulaceae bacterium]
MNRIKLGPLAGMAKSPSDFCELSSDSSAGESSPDRVDARGDNMARHLGIANDASASSYRTPSSIFLPVHYESRYAYPLLIWLHPNGSSHQHLDEVMPKISERNFLGVALAGTERLDQDDTYGWLQTSEAIEWMINQVAWQIDTVASRFNIDRQRIFIAGQGNGGTMAYRIALKRPNWFAGVASLNGSLPANLNPLGNWRDCRDVPVFWAHGRRSVYFPESNLCHQLKLLHVAGFDVTLRQYPVADQLPNQVLGDLNEWMMSQLSSSGANIIG